MNNNNNNNFNNNATKNNINNSNTNGQNSNDFLTLVNAIQSIKCLNSKQLVSENEILFVKRFYIFLFKVTFIFLTHKFLLLFIFCYKLWTKAFKVC